MAHQTQTESRQQAEQVRHAWDAIASGYDVQVTPSHYALAEDVVRRLDLDPGTRFLDVATGSGALAIAAARAGARVVATDISPSMIQLLDTRIRDEGLSSTIIGRVMDGHELGFANDSFDVSGSQFGVMLFPDLPRGLREMVRVTRPGGRVVMVTFSGPPSGVEFLSFFMAAARQAVPGFTGLPTDPPPLPFQVSDPATLSAAMENAGLTDVTVDISSEVLEFATAEEHLTWLESSNPIGTAMVRGFTDDQRAAVAARLDDLLRERAGTDSVARLSNPVNIAIGTA